MTTQEHLHRDFKRNLARRWFLKDCGVGLGSIALASLLGERRAQAAKMPSTEPLAPRLPHFAPKAKRVIYLFMAGAPSHLELFDNKPALTKYDGTLPPAELLKGYRAAFINPNSALLGPKFKFARHGRAGAELQDASGDRRGNRGEVRHRQLHELRVLPKRSQRHGRRRGPSRGQKAGLSFDGGDPEAAAGFLHRCRR